MFGEHVWFSDGGKELPEPEQWDSETVGDGRAAAIAVRRRGCLQVDKDGGREGCKHPPQRGNVATLEGMVSHEK